MHALKFMARPEVRGDDHDMRRIREATHVRLLLSKCGSECVLQ